MTGKRALVTGGAQGIGKSIVRTLQRCGADVLVLDRDPKALQTLMEEKVELRGAVETLQIDLLDVAGVQASLDKYFSDSGPVDYVVNCAGVAIFQPYHETDVTKAFDIMFGVNVRALALVTQLATAAMVKHGIKGAVVHISSQSSTLPLADHLLYSSSKATVDHMTRIQAFELGPKGIRVNAVRPTVVLTELAKKAWDPVKLEAMKSRIPLRQLAEPEDVAKAVTWLLSDQASMVTGSCLAVDGGRSMGGFGC